MLSIVIITITLALAAGLLVKYVLDHTQNPYEITWPEFGIGIGIIILILTPLTAYIGWHISKANLVSYEEFWNGWELAAVREDIPCSRDGPCRHTYDCDPYQVYVSRTCTDADGDSYECGGYETRYHDCPYVKSETTYSVATSLGAYTIAAYRFPENPQEYRWRNSVRIPDSVIRYAGVGIPLFWQQAKDRVDSNAPGPVTARRNYDNFILASDQTILRQYSADVARYRGATLLPPITSDVHDFYRSDKVHFVGFTPSNSSTWQSALDRLNAAFGSELQGDLHLVVVKNDTTAGNPDPYTMALKAHWLDTSLFKKTAFPKNGVGVIIGTRDGATIAWARAFTGMPLGNERLLVTLQNKLRDKPLILESLIGVVHATFVTNKNGEKVVSTKHEGLIPSLVWGDNDPSTRFTRVGMTGAGTGSGSGFLYLNSEIEPTDQQKMWIGIIIFFLSLGVWFGAALYGTRSWRPAHFDTYRRFR